jgi:hypothetical protein
MSLPLNLFGAHLLAQIEWNLPEWLTVVGFPLVLVGLVLAGLQGRDTKRVAYDASTAARESRNAAERSLTATNTSQEAAEAGKRASEGSALAADSARASAESARVSADAAREAIERTERNLADNHMLILIPQLHALARDFDVAQEAQSREATLAVLSAWVGIASELLGLLEADDSEEAELMRRLDQSASRTSEAKNALIGDKAEIKMATRGLSATYSEVYFQSAKVIGRMRAFSRDRSK